MSKASRREAQERANMTMEQLEALDQQDNARHSRYDAFTSGDASEVLEQWDTDPPSYEELLAIVRNMLVRQTYPKM